MHHMEHCGYYEGCSCAPVATQTLITSKPGIVLLPLQTMHTVIAHLDNTNTALHGIESKGERLGGQKVQTNEMNVG